VARDLQRQAPNIAALEPDLINRLLGKPQTSLPKPAKAADYRVISGAASKPIPRSREHGGGGYWFIVLIVIFGIVRCAGRNSESTGTRPYYERQQPNYPLDQYRFETPAPRYRIERNPDGSIRAIESLEKNGKTNPLLDSLRQNRSIPLDELYKPKSTLPAKEPRGVPPSRGDP
jgi:hypothetical protein